MSIPSGKLYGVLTPQGLVEVRTGSRPSFFSGFGLELATRSAVADFLQGARSRGLRILYMERA